MKLTPEQARAKMDDAVRQLWLAFRDASDDNAEIMTDADLELWGLVTHHNAVQSRLDATTK